MAEVAGRVEPVVAEDPKGAAEAVGAQARNSAAKVSEAAKSGDLGDVAGELKGAAGDLKNAAVDQGRALYESAKTQATGFADQRKNDAAQSVADLAASLRETGSSFGERPNIQSFVGSAADGLDQLAGSIRDRSFADLYADAEDFARRSPMTVAAVAALAGFLLARFIKSSSEDLAETSAASRRSAQGGRTRSQAAHDA